MKSLILVSSVLAVATAGWEPVHEKYHGPLHYPKIHKGVPVEPAAVQHARMLHLMAVAAASHGYGDVDHYNHEEHNNKWHGPLHYPKIHKGVPIETKEVQIARAEHMKAVSAIGHDYHHENNGDEYNHHHHEEVKKWHGPFHYPKIYKGVPVEPKEVQIARAAHLKAVSETGHHDYYQDYHHHDGPVDTIEVEAARAKHLAAVNEALARNSHGIAHHYRKRRGAESYVHFKQVVDHVVPILVSSHDNGAPMETPEVQHARAEHLAAHALLSSNHEDDEDNHYEYSDDQDEHDYYHYNEVPVIGLTPMETPEVQHARAAHLAEHAAANTKYY